jgi:hypothetical protein
VVKKSGLGIKIALDALTIIRFGSLIILVMTSSIKFLTTSLISYVTGLLAVSGHLDASSTNSLTIGFQDIIGGVLIIAPILYNLEQHSWMAKNKSVQTTTTQTSTPPQDTTTTQVTQPA